MRPGPTCGHGASSSLPRADGRAARARGTFVRHSLAGGRRKRGGTVRRRSRAQRRRGVQGRGKARLLARKTGGRCVSSLDGRQHPGWASDSSRHSSVQTSRNLYSIGQISRSAYSRCQFSRSMYSRGHSSRSMYSRRQISRSTYSSGQIKISRSLCSSYRGVVCDAPSTTCSRLACIVCALRSGWGKTSLWFANFSTLIILKCKRRGNRARSKSRLGSISPLNSRSKNSVCTGIPIKVSV